MHKCKLAVAKRPHATREFIIPDHKFGHVISGISHVEADQHGPLAVFLDEFPDVIVLGRRFQSSKPCSSRLFVRVDAWLWKFEAIGRYTRSDSCLVSVTGFEYRFYGVQDTAADVGVLVELLYDGRDANAPPSALDNDKFAGTRLALNDANDTSMLAGLAIYADTQELFVNVEAGRRFGDNISVELRLRAFANSEPHEALCTIEQDDYIQVRLNWYY